MENVSDLFYKFIKTTDNIGREAGLTEFCKEFLNRQYLDIFEDEEFLQHQIDIIEKGRTSVQLELLDSVIEAMCIQIRKNAFHRDVLIIGICNERELAEYLGMVFMRNQLAVLTKGY